MLKSSDNLHYRKKHLKKTDMKILQKTSSTYHSPQVISAEVDMMTALCQSIRFNVQVDELHNMNSAEGADDPGNGHYFEF